jgi:carbonic anhydrase
MYKYKGFIMRKISEYMYKNREFQENYVKNNNQKLVDLAQKGQTPQALFIGCVDSRMLPNLITDTGPGDMLIVRNIGNFVSPHDENKEDTSVASALEFAVKVLEVKEIIICGHTQCGAIYTIYSDLDRSTFPYLSSWLTQGEKLKIHIDETYGKFDSREMLLRTAEKASVQLQLENLLTYPFVQEKVEDGSLKIDGWIYDIQTGRLSYYDEEEGIFKSIEADARSTS